MANHGQTGSDEQVLAGILGRFDTDEKDDLGEELAQAFGLDRASPFAPQLAALLGRNLGDLERFQVDTLQRAMRYSGAEEEEEEEEE